MTEDEFKAMTSRANKLDRALDMLGFSGQSGDKGENFSAGRYVGRAQEIVAQVMSNMNADIEAHKAAKKEASKPVPRKVARRV